MKLWKKILLGMAAVLTLLAGAILFLLSFIKPGGCGSQTPGLKLRKDASELSMFLEQYSERYGDVPTEEQGIFALVELPTAPPIPKNYKPIVSNKKALLDPWSTPYILKRDPDRGYKIITLGKDKKEGGEGRNSDFNILKEEEYPREFRPER